MILGGGRRPSFTKMLVTCFSTARSVTNIRSAIAWFERPSAMYFRTSRSRARPPSGSSRRCLPTSSLTTVGSGRAALGDPPHRGANSSMSATRSLAGSPRLRPLGEDPSRSGSTYWEDEHAGRLVVLRISLAARSPHRSVSAASGCPRPRRPACASRRGAADPPRCRTARRRRSRPPRATGRFPRAGAPSRRRAPHGQGRAGTGARGGKSWRGRLLELKILSGSGISGSARAEIAQVRQASAPLRPSRR